MKYQLSTLFLLILVVAVSRGWYVDHYDPSRRDIVGTWHYPTPDVLQFGYITSLEIRPNGTFTKIQNYRTGGRTFDGKYYVTEDGKIVFNVETMQTIPSWTRCPMRSRKNRIGKFAMTADARSTNQAIWSCM